MVNEAQFRVNGYVATQPKLGYTKTGERTVSMRVGWTPRRVNKTTGEWEDQPSSFVSVLCLRKVADHAAICLHRGEPVILSGTLRVREYTDQKGDKRIGVDVIAESLGHDMSRGISHYAKVQQSAGLTAEEAERAAQQQGLADAEATGGPLEAPDDADAPGRPGAVPGEGAGEDDQDDRDEHDEHQDVDDDRDDDGEAGADSDSDGPATRFRRLTRIGVPASPEGLAATAGASA
jgi:single-strand DNA-binding protein